MYEYAMAERERKKQLSKEVCCQLPTTTALVVFLQMTPICKVPAALLVDCYCLCYAQEASECSSDHMLFFHKCCAMSLCSVIMTATQLCPASACPLVGSIESLYRRFRSLYNR